MKRFALIVLFFCLFLFGCQNQPATSSNKLKVAATIYPLADIVKNIGGNKVDVYTVLPPGASPHTFELTTGSVKDLQGAKTIFTIGKGFDNYINNVSDSVPGAKLYEVSKNVEFLAGNAEEGEAVNPHYFLSLENGKIITQSIADYLSQIDPQDRNFYQTNAATYIVKLDETAAQISKELSNLSSRDLITFHDAWPYFAKEFNLSMVATFEPFPGKEPTPKYLEDLAIKIKQYKIKVVFAEVQFSTDVIQQFVKDQGVKMYILDPEGRYSYIDLFKHNADIIYQALK